MRCYHGLGDTLQFVRYLSHLRARASRVTLEAQPELVTLLTGIAGADRIIPFDVAAPTASDRAIEIMELPHALRAEPDPAPYLGAIAGGAGRGLAGVCWQAGGWDRARSIDLATLLPVLPANVVSLQRAAGPGLLDAAGLRDPLDGDMDIVAMARLVASLDHVITVDTMIAHLAGALGRPVSLLLRYSADWRWGGGRCTPWYGSVRCLRQRSPGDWSGPLGELAGIVGGKR